MYKINVHLKGQNGRFILPDSFKYCTGETPNEFFAWREDDDIVVETTISDGKLLQRKIEEWEKSNPEKLIVYSVYYDDADGESLLKRFGVEKRQDILWSMMQWLFWLSSESPEPK